ncbi:sorting nexin-24 isoform X2 [Galendromus occidentalis]|uniref:Sorting nexin-24 isoform X2 n=1 Tax=Galendromus occidentalis TaxID=34638 RepID=A0AAJ6VYP0_9ACAR|nr:sorting nexin-24 isoform X2 [Galendromus occidentalis]
MKILIPSTRTVEHNSNKYVLYTVQVVDNYISLKFERRYSDFHSLNKTLRRLYPNLELPEFPPKKIRNLNDRVTQERKVLLEAYLQSAVDQLCYDLPGCLQDFLDLDKSTIGLLNDEDISSDHQPILSFVEEPFKLSESPTLPNTIVDATLDAIY